MKQYEAYIDLKVASFRYSQALSYRIPAARPSTNQSRRGWNDFISEYNDTLEWLERMENMIRQTELSDVLTEDVDLLLEVK